MPKITKEQYIERAKEKLRKNLAFFKTIIPGFDMTEEQIDRYVRDRMDAHLIAKSMPVHDDAAVGFHNKAYEYMPGKYITKEYRRMYQDMPVEGGSEAAEKYNHMVFDGLSRDDETGRAKRKNFFHTVINAPFELDRNILKKDFHDPEFAQYCATHMQLGNMCFSYSSVVNSSPYKMTDDARFNTVKRFSEDAGSIMMGYTTVFGSEDILSVPLDMFTHEQFIAVLTAATGLVASDAKTEEEKERVRIAKYIIDHQSYQLAQYGLRNNIAAFENAGLQPYETEDFTERPELEDNVYGGWSQRVEKIREQRNVLNRNICGDADFAEAVNAFEGLADVLTGIRGVPDEKDCDAIIAAAQQHKKSGEKFNMKYAYKLRWVTKEINKLDPNSEEQREQYQSLTQDKEELVRAKAALEEVISLCRPFEQRDYIETLVFYQKKDSRGEAKENVPTVQELKEARERALETVPQRSFDDVLDSQLVDSERMVSGFLNVQKNEMEEYIPGYNGSIRNGYYTISERFEVVCSEVLALNDRTDSEEMTFVKDEIKRLKRLNDGGMTPGEAKNAIERLKFACESYVNNPKKRQNNRWHAVNSALMSANEVLGSMKDIQAVDEFTTAADEIMQRLEASFAEAEAVTGGAINRLDSVMIAGKTLRGWLTEEVMRKNPEASDPEYNLSMEETKAIEDPDPEHVAHIVLAAMTEGKKVEFFSLDANNGYCINNTDGKPENEIKKPSVLENANKFTQKRLRDSLAGKVNIDFAKKISKEENWARIDTCRAAVKRLNNCIQSEAGFANEYKRQLFELWSAAHRTETGVPTNVPQELAPQLGNSGITITRGAIPAFTIGYMIAKMNMSVKDIFDPAAKRAEKTEAVSHIIDLFTKDIKDEALNNARVKEIADIAVNGCDRLHSEINSVMSAIDINSDEQLFSSATKPLFGMMGAAHDMFQDGLGSSKDSMMRKVWNEAVAEKYNCEVGSPEAEAVQKSINHKAMMMDVINRTSTNEKRLAMMGTGCRPDRNNAAFEILTSEFVRRNVAKKTAQSRDYFNSVNDEELGRMTQFGLRVSNMVGENEGRFVRDYTSLLPDFAPDSVIKFAGMAFKGKIRNDLVMQQDEKGVLVVNREHFKELNKKLGEQHKARTEKRKLKEGMSELSRNVAENVRRIDAAQQKHNDPQPDDPQPKLPE